MKGCIRGRNTPIVGIGIGYDGSILLVFTGLG